MFLICRFQKRSEPLFAWGASTPRLRHVHFQVLFREGIFKRSCEGPFCFPAFLTRRNHMTFRYMEDEGWKVHWWTIGMVLARVLQGGQVQPSLHNNICSLRFLENLQQCLQLEILRELAAMFAVWDFYRTCSNVCSLRFLENLQLELPQDWLTNLSLAPWQRCRSKKNDNKVDRKQEQRNWGCEAKQNSLLWPTFPKQNFHLE